MPREKDPLLVHQDGVVESEPLYAASDGMYLHFIMDLGVLRIGDQPLHG
jgi:hypothetical protein